MRVLTFPSDDAAELYVQVRGSGPDVLFLAGGPGCVNYLSSDRLAPAGTRAWFPDPRGVGRSTGGPHDLSRAVADLETIRAAAGIERWAVVGHSFGSDLAVRYALDHLDRVTSVTGVAGHGLHQDRSWSQIYEQHPHAEDDVPIDWNPEVHRALTESFQNWIHDPALFRALADSPVPMAFIAAQQDIRPDWPLRQLATLVPYGTFHQLPDVSHNFWLTHPSVWIKAITLHL